MRKDLDEFYKRKEFLKDENRSKSVKKKDMVKELELQEKILTICVTKIHLMN